MIINGNNLGERHRDFNSKVSEYIDKQINLEDLKSQPNKSDLDELFKIDVASKYKNIDYILDVLKCGDVFYITRALKCLWLYTDEYSRFIKPEYLESNVFPSMSKRMKNKTLTTISIHVRNAERAADFYKYCEDAKLYNHAVKFLVFTPNSFKLHFLQSGSFEHFNTSKFLKQFVGSSFELALAYLAKWDYSECKFIVYELRFLYFESDEYLNMLEKYMTIELGYPHSSYRLGIRISKDILKKHKERILKRPLLYINILNKNMLIKYLTIKDVKSTVINLLPTSTRSFWSLDFYHTYKFILEKIPTHELFYFMKGIYKSKYNKDTFEVTIQFYNLKYYEMFNIDEREAWALQHIERDKELPGIKNYIWYKFVSFQKAFTGIKRYIFLTPSKFERSKIVNILPETARNQKDVNEILDYYYERHVNESEGDKESFINKVIEHHDIYSFNNECWTSLDKLFYSLDVYTTGSYRRGEYKFKSLVYHILHEKDLLEALKQYIDAPSEFYHLESLVNELSEERKVIVAQYLCNYFANNIKTLMENPDYGVSKQVDDYWETDDIKYQIETLVYKVWSILYCFKRPNDECPKIVVQFMEANKDNFLGHKMYRKKIVKQTEEDFVRTLKKDKQMAVNAISEIRCNANRWSFRLCRLFRKLKVYFPNDVGKKYLNYFLEYLSDIPRNRREYRNIKMAVVGVFYLADLETMINLLEKYAPSSPKIDYIDIDSYLLQVQKAICRLSYRPRPPLPLSVIQKYITGDYVHYCTPTVYNYFSNLPSLDEFIDNLLDAPLSIQKHGMRFAFRAYDAETLKPIILKAWGKTKNVSLRMILYVALFDRVSNGSEEVQKELYEVLKLYTSQLNHDDHESVYALLVCDDLPDVFKGDFIETAWLTVSKLPEKSVDIKRRISVIYHMESYIHLVQREFPRLEIIDDHVNSTLRENYDSEDCVEYYFKDLIKAKWNLTAKYIVSFNNEMELQQSLQLMETIMRKSMQSWNLVINETYTVRKFTQKFIKIIMDKELKSIESYADMLPIYQCIRDNLKINLKKDEIYLTIWQLKLSTICRNIIHDERSKAEDSNYIPSEVVARNYGKAIGKIIKCCVNNNEFYHCFYESIADFINDIGRTISEVLHTDSWGFIYDVCDSLIRRKMTEVYLIVLNMLPRDPERYWEREHGNIITNIKKQSTSHEVRTFLYEKYVLSDYEVRRYV